MKNINYKGHIISNNNSKTDIGFPKRNYSSTEMKKLQRFSKQPKTRKNNDIDIGLITGVGLKEIRKVKVNTQVREEEDSPFQSNSVIVENNAKKPTKLMEVVKLKPKLKEGLPQEIKKQQLSKSVETDDSNTVPMKKIAFKKKVIDRLTTLPKLENPAVSLVCFKKHLLSSFDPSLKKIKSQHYFVFQHDTEQPILGYRSKSKIEVASLTKIMTFYVCVLISEEYQINLAKTKIKIDEDIEGFCGTSALLEEGQLYTVQQLLYGLMLPSGNDAALSIAKWGGSLLRQNSNEPKIKAFVERMNSEAKKLEMRDTKYGNPHGLPHKNAQTTCEDMAKLCSVCLKIPLFLKVVGTEFYRFKVEYEKSKKRKALVEWENTNKLLRRKGFIGIKTGITVTAGPCLASAYQFHGKTYIVILAKCNKSSRRFKETRKLLVHCLERLEYEEKLSEEEKKQIRSLNRENPDLDSDYSDEQKEFDFKKYDLDEMNRRARIITANH